MKIKFYILGFVLLSAVNVCFAPPPPPPPSGGPGCWPPPCVPIDGGISLLVAAGVLYGGKKIYSIKKHKTNS